MKTIYESIIIGAGPCGIAASIKLKDAGVNFLLIESSTPGGKVNIAPRVDNYPGFDKVLGPDLAFALFERLLEKNIVITGENVKNLAKSQDIFEITTENSTYFAKTVLIATGTKERKLALPNEDKLFGKGISYCAICDGHFFKGKDVLIAGGGNAALKEAIYLAKLVNHLYLIHRRNEFRGLNKYVDELKAMDNVTILTPCVVSEIIGEDKLESVKIQNVETKEEVVISLSGLFPLIGQLPNSKFVNIENVLNEWGTIPADKKMMTSCSGLFAGGDILPRDIRQIYLAEHDGNVAANSIIEYLGKNHEN